MMLKRSSSLSSLFKNISLKNLIKDKINFKLYEKDVDDYIIQSFKNLQKELHKLKNINSEEENNKNVTIELFKKQLRRN